MNVRCAVLALPGIVLLLTGCPQLGGEPPEPTAAIDASATSGPVPLMVSVDADRSTAAAGIASYAWDFAGQRSASGVVATHTFSDPGRYVITLTVRDADGATATAQQVIRVAGDPIEIAVQADRETGDAPLTVQFSTEVLEDGGDTLRDFLWEFGDGTSISATNPIHTYIDPGIYEVALTATTAGGVSGEATLRVVVTDPNEPPPDDDDDDDPNAAP